MKSSQARGSKLWTRFHRHFFSFFALSKPSESDDLAPNGEFFCIVDLVHALLWAFITASFIRYILIELLPSNLCLRVSMTDIRRGFQGQKLPLLCPFSPAKTVDVYVRIRNVFLRVFVFVESHLLFGRATASPMCTICPHFGSWLSHMLQRHWGWHGGFAHHLGLGPLSKIDEISLDDVATNKLWYSLWSRLTFSTHSTSPPEARVKTGDSGFLRAQTTVCQESVRSGSYCTLLQLQTRGPVHMNAYALGDTTTRPRGWRA